MLNVVIAGAGKWAQECWAPLLAAHTDLYRVAAVVDPHDAPGAHRLAAAIASPAPVVYSSLADALDRHPDLDAGIVVTSPEQHAPTIVELARSGLSVLCEKPLATTSEDLDMILTTVNATGVHAAVIQNYRYQNRIQLARQTLTTGTLGPVRYVAVRFAADYREPGSWDVGDAHEMDDPLLVEASVHHLDMIRYLTGADIVDVTAITANPDGSSFAGDCIGGLLLRLENGAFALYEATLLAAGSESRWRNEHYRIECAEGVLVCDGPHVTVIRGRHIDQTAAPDTDMFDGHRHQLRAFADWHNGGPPMETTVADNARSIAAVFAAIDSSHRGQTTTVALPTVAPTRT